MFLIKISVNHVRAMLKHARKAGVDTDAVLASIDLNETRLSSALHAHQLWQAYDRLGRALRMALGTAQGLRPLNEIDREILMYYVVAADTLRSALENIVKFSQSYQERTGAIHELESHLPTAMVFRGRDRNFAPGSVFDEALMLSSLRSINQMLYLFSWLINAPAKPIRLVLPSAFSKKLEQQLENFNCPISYGTDAFEMWFPASLLDRPVVRDLTDAKVFLSCVTDASPFLFPQTSLNEVIVELIERHCHTTGYMLTLQQLAVVLNTSETTLRRRLQSDGESFSAIRQTYQLQLAQRFLSTAEFSVDEIALRIGFQDSNAFRRSFKRWTGLTPSEYRIQHTRH